MKSIWLQVREECKRINASLTERDKTLYKEFSKYKGYL